MSNAFISKLRAQHQRVGHCICLGLDPDIDRLPDQYPKTVRGVQSFLTDVISATHDLVLCYKPNVSFFEGLGLEGLAILSALRSAIPETVPIILDGKRGDIGNTSRFQARFLFEHLGADAVTLHPYMGIDSLAPFFEYKSHYHFVLALTSNPSAVDFEMATLQSGEPTYINVLHHIERWNAQYGNVGAVVGATHDQLRDVSQRFPSVLKLIPGVGAQGGDYSTTLRDGMNADGLCIINMSRSILYISQTESCCDDMRTYLTSFMS